MDGLALDLAVTVLLTFNFNSPEYEVLKISYWDQSMFVVRVSCIVSREASIYFIYTTEAFFKKRYSKVFLCNSLLNS